MLIEKNKNFAVIKFNSLFYSVNSLILANTLFSEDFHTEAAFAFSNLGQAKYHLVKLISKKKSSKNIDLEKVYAYANVALKTDSSS